MSECILWTGNRDSKGYGRLWRDGKNVKAHRDAYEKQYGPIPDGMFICHKCDVRSCVNPDHLFLGTLEENNADRHHKGRDNCGRGEGHGAAKLSADQVRSIRAIPKDAPLKPFAERYGVTRALISYVRAGKGWAHVV